VEILKVSSRSNPNAVAGALAGVVRHSSAAELQVVGAGALNQAVKAVAIARGFLTPSGIDLVCVPAFADIEIAGEGRTALRLLCEDRYRTPPAVAGEVGSDATLTGSGARSDVTVDLTALEPDVAHR
jgi:stage V sporulation protein S